jgi:hypothetical protein
MGHDPDSAQDDLEGQEGPFSPSLQDEGGESAVFPIWMAPIRESSFLYQMICIGDRAEDPAAVWKPVPRKNVRIDCMNIRRWASVALLKYNNNHFIQTSFVFI